MSLGRENKIVIGRGEEGLERWGRRDWRGRGGTLLQSYSWETDTKHILTRGDQRGVWHLREELAWILSICRGSWDTGCQ